MKRLILGILIAGSLLVGSGQAAFAAQTDNFTITKFDAEYSLGRDGENRSTLAATWRITANFPPNQNHGIAPIFVKNYDGHSTSFSLKSVTDEQGKTLEYNWNGDELRIGKKDVYVQGEKTYVIKFTQRDVTKHYDNTGRDEFYWDVIGNEWRVPMENVRVSVKFDESLQAARRGEAFCYVGKQGSRQRCNVNGDKSEIVANVNRLDRR
jgi:putative membrane protein